jgi:ribonuclease BN (tRNA processing enzyme)
MQLTVVGCGDAFGAGGRLQTAFHVRTKTSTFLIDCGASSLIGLRRFDLDPSAIDTVFLTHLHGDHFGGLPWLLIDALYVNRRTRPLVVAGPRGTEARLVTATEALYPGTLSSKPPFALDFVVYEEGKRHEIGGVGVTPFEVKHSSGAPPYALRFDAGGTVLAFTGDTGWTESLVTAANGADLFITECFQYDVTMDMHLDYKMIDANYRRLGVKRVLLTHMGEAMLARRDEVDVSRYLLAEDGLSLTVQCI